MKWTKYYKLVLIIGSWRKNMDYSSSPLGELDGTHPIEPAVGVLSVWWKRSAFEGVLFRAVLLQLSTRQNSSLASMESTTLVLLNIVFI